MKKLMFALFVLPVTVICIMTSNAAAYNPVKCGMDGILIGQIQRTITADIINISFLSVQIQYATNPFARLIDSILLSQADAKLDADEFALSQAERQLAYDQTH